MRQATIDRDAQGGTRTLPVPPLESGDVLTADEFLSRYDALPEVKKAELVGGIVYMASPVHAKAHAQPDSLIQLWMGTYAARTAGLAVYANVTLHLDDDNVFQPDSVLRVLPEQGGATKLTEDDYLSGAPELIVEIAATTASLDAREKFRAYERFGVREYILWRTWDQALDWFVLEGGKYRRQAADESGIVRSPHFQGLAVNVTSLLSLDAAGVLATLERELSTRTPNS